MIFLLRNNKFNKFLKEFIKNDVADIIAMKETVIRPKFIIKSKMGVKMMLK